MTRGEAEHEFHGLTERNPIVARKVRTGTLKSFKEASMLVVVKATPPFTVDDDDNCSMTSKQQQDYGSVSNLSQARL